jgi:predicted transposase YbfD/YdcC
MDLFQFFARFHVLVLHLPIGILMLAAVLEMAVRFKEQPRSALLNVVWFWGAISAVAACVLGWMLSQADGYSTEAIFIHRSFGISVAIAAWICWWVFKRNSPPVAIYSLSSIVLALLFSTGHYGANMTHGETYLVEYAPNPIRQIAGFSPHKAPRPPITSLAQADVYLDVISPLFEKRCASCHNDSKQKGGLNLASFASLQQGGKSGDTLVPGNPEHSELYQRITLDHDAKGYMPAEGKKPLTEQEVAVIKWWITTGAPNQGPVTEFVHNQQHKTLLSKLFAIHSSSLADIPPISDEQYQQLVNAGFVVKQIAQNSNYLDLDMSISELPLSPDTLTLLGAVKSHVLYLNLAKKSVNKNHLEVIAQLPNLQKLRLEHSNVTTNALAPLKKAANLYYLNLFATQVDNDVLPMLNEFAALQQVYLSASKVDAEAFERHSLSGDTKMYYSALARNDAKIAQNNKHGLKVE